MKRSIKVSIATVLILFVAAALLMPEPQRPKRSPEMNFLFGDFGSINRENLKSHALPLRLTLAALIIEARANGWIPADSLNYRQVLERFGFFYPTEIVNWPSQLAPPRFELPVGFTEETVYVAGPFAQLRAMNLSCASCHAGRIYNAQGQPTQQAWMGLPNTSLDLESYTNSIYKGLKKSLNNWNETLAVAEKIRPAVHWSEPLIEKYILTSIARSRLEESQIDRAFPFFNGSPGVTNGVAALKLAMGLVPKNQMVDESGFTSIPTVADRYFRSSLLYDGFYSPPGQERFRTITEIQPGHQTQLAKVVSVFSLPSMGITMAELPQVADDIAATSAALIGFDQRPDFPGEKNKEQAQIGFTAFEKHCSSCHGQYSWTEARPKLISFPNKLIPQSEMLTDPRRWMAITPELLQKLGNSNVSKLAEPKNTGGYVAPLLTSIWATAPYLHNGSVPTLWNLMNPQSRPAKFLVGGHHLDYEKVGLLLKEADNGTMVYPDENDTFSEPVMYDTSKPGQSNDGHTDSFAPLSQDEKKQIIEFLKYL